MKSVLIVGPRSSEHVKLWVRSFSRAGHKVEVLSLREARGPLFWRALVTILGGTRSRADLTIIHSMGLHGLIGWLRLKGGRTVLVPWGSEVTQAVHGGWRAMLARGLLSRADVVITTSAAMATTLGHRWPWTSSRTRVVSWGVDPEFFKHQLTPEHVAAARDELGFDKETILVVAPRGQSETYRHGSIVAAFSTALGANPNLRLVAIGSDDSANVDCGAAILTVPRLSKSDLACLLFAADAVVSVPPRDQRSTTVLEAIASGAQVLLSDIPAYREIAATGVTITLLDEPIEASLTLALSVLGRADLRQGARNRAIMRQQEYAETQMAKVMAICIGGEV